MPDEKKQKRKLNSRNQDCSKGAVESDRQEGANTSMQGQLGHQDQDPLIRSADSDFPEPGGNPEHTGKLQITEKT
ncbi:MAG TPA: hypothetical protein VEI26_00630 [Terriglobales bacterium]|nr:hypothetical protein [Terriglobales bacterium]